MNKKILSIFALIMAISILGVSCAEKATDPNNGGGTTIVTPPQYPQSTLDKATVEKIVTALGATVQTTSKNFKMNLTTGTIANAPVLGTYGATAVAIADGDTAITKHTVIGADNIVAAINAAITKALEADGAYETGDVVGTETSSIKSIGKATVYSVSQKQIIIAIPFVDIAGKNGVIGLPITLPASDGKLGTSYYVDFAEGANDIEMDAITDTGVQVAIKGVFEGMKIATKSSADVVFTFGAGNPEIAAGGVVTITDTATATKPDSLAAKTDIYGQLNGTAQANNVIYSSANQTSLYVKLVDALEAAGLVLDKTITAFADSANAATKGGVTFVDGDTGTSAAFTIGVNATPTAITVTRKVGYAPASDATGVGHILTAGGLTIKVVLDDQTQDNSLTWK